MKKPIFLQKERASTLLQLARLFQANKQVSSNNFDSVLKLDKSFNPDFKMSIYPPIFVKLLPPPPPIENCLNISVLQLATMDGKTIHNPEMRFIIDGENAYPYYFRNDLMGFEYQAMDWENVEDGSTTFIEIEEQANFTGYANIWLENIKIQQKLE